MQCIHVLLKIHIFGFTKDELLPDVDKESQVLDRMIRYFGPVPEALLQHISDDKNDSWRQVLGVLNSCYGISGEKEPWQHFSQWGKEVFSELATKANFQYLNSDFKRLIGRMMNLDPAKRATVDELLHDHWWKNANTE
jgi:serine/threonine protein kinase